MTPSSQGLASHHEPSRRESASLAALGTTHTPSLKHDLRLGRALGHQLGELEELQDQRHDVKHDGVELEARPFGRVPGRHQWHVPRFAVAAKVPILHAIAGFQDLETRVFEGLGADGRVHQVGEPIANLDVPLDPAVVLALGVVLVREAPLVTSEDSPGLEHAEDFAVDPRTVRGVASRLDCVDGVERRVREGHLHEVRLHELDLAAEALTGGDRVASIHLKLVDGDRLDARPQKLRDVARRAADAASAIEDFRAAAHEKAPGEVIFVAQNGLPEGLTGAPIREMETGAPPPLVELSGQVVIRVHESGVVLVTILRGLALVVLIVVPVDLAMLLRRRQRSKELGRLLQGSPDHGSRDDQHQRNCCDA
mmetsp:Transcript_20375/g.61011  ORF Transcript_20375/g.61011 Transcript_20375/m.61011 type:complete len:367 (-) Transcript_20375:184-1284(-)